MTKLKNIKDVNPEDWKVFFASLGLKPYTATQVYQWLFKRGVSNFDEMTNLSKETREILSKNFYISNLKVLNLLEDDDGTKKFLFELEDKNRIESVFIRSERDRLTVCISSQVGCALGCKFCRTAGLGFIRNLSPSEIIDQVLHVKHFAEDRGEKVTNIVLMGMGEPLNNYENVKLAISVMKDESGMSFAKRRITLSTAGIVPGIKKMVEDNLGVKLAISLNATTDDMRQKIMPIGERYSIADVLEACKEYNPPGSRWRTTFEYVLIKGVNDSLEDANRLTALMSQLPSKVNLIPYNAFPESDLESPEGKSLTMFHNVLLSKHIQVNVRRGRGQRILAACGQLAASS